MNPVEETTEPEVATVAQEGLTRRTLLAHAAVAGAGVAALTAFGGAPHQAEAAMRQRHGAVGSPVMTESQFRLAIAPVVKLSWLLSQMAVARCTRPDAKEFAGFELGETIAVSSVLKDLGTPTPSLDAKHRAVLAKVKSAPDGAAFDKAYIAAELEGHMFLRNTAMQYLAESVSIMHRPAESQGRHIATISLAVFKEHVAICTRISHELGM